MNLRQVEAFHAVMVAGSITRAARILHISQPAVSRLIADFERSVGFALFVREHRQLQPTDEARLLFAEVQRAFVGLEQIAAVAEAVRTYSTGSLRVVTMPSLSTRLAPEIIAAFASRYPHVSVWLEVRPRGGVLEWIGSAQYDVGITIGPIDDPAISVAPLTAAPVACVMPVEHPLARRKRISLPDLDGERFISLGRDSHFRYRVDEMFKAAGVRREMMLEARTAEAVFGLVAAGMGITVMGPLIAQHIDDTKLAVRPLQPPMEVDLVLIRPSQQPIPRITRRFEEAAHDYVAAFAG